MDEWYLHSQPNLTPTATNPETTWVMLLYVLSGYTNQQVFLGYTNKQLIASYALTLFCAALHTYMHNWHFIAIFRSSFSWQKYWVDLTVLCSDIYQHANNTVQRVECNAFASHNRLVYISRSSLVIRNYNFCKCNFSLQQRSVFIRYC